MVRPRFLFVSGLAAIVASFLCCFGPLLILLVGAGAATSATGFTDQYQPVLWGVAALALGIASWQYWRKRTRRASPLVLQSVLTCPHCGHQSTESMPENACVYFHVCARCQVRLKPKAGDCCVFCSYGTVACPPVQAGVGCC